MSASVGSDPIQLHVPCARGTEMCVVKELELLGATVRSGAGVVHAAGPIGLVADANVFSRCASRVLLEIARFEDVRSQDDLKDALSRVPFEQRIDDKGTFAVEAHLRDVPLTHSHYAALLVKDALVDRFRALGRPRPNVDVKRPSLQFVLAWNGPTAILSLDTSGDPLHRRGYRRGVEGKAPMKETLAASILALAHADVARPFLDPVCGTGTLVVEQVWRMMKRAPGRDRRFAFERWRDRPPELDRALAQARTRARDEELERPEQPVHASDWHADAIAAATQSFAQAQISEWVKLERVDARRADPPGERPVIVGNLPFGERLGDRGGDKPLQLEGFYRTLGERLRSMAGARVILFTALPQADRLLQLDQAGKVRRYRLRSGDLAAELLRVDVEPTGSGSAP